MEQEFHDEKIKRLFDSVKENNEAETLLNKLKVYHQETYEHCIRVGKLCKEIGKINNFSEEKIKILETAGLLHDIGKLNISLEILDKNSKLDEKERKEIEKHPEESFYKLKNFGNIKEIVMHHHSHQKKSYPCGANEIKKEFCKFAQIVAVCDMFDALTNKRSYKKEFSIEEVKKILEEEFTGNKIYIGQILNLKS